MKRRLSRAVRLVALLGIAGALSGCTVYPAGYAYSSPGYYRAPAYRTYYRPYGGGGYGYGRPWGYGYRGYYGRPYW
jgi:hypothetical protein